MATDEGQLTAALKALADPSRRQILEALRAGTLCVSAVAGRLGVTQSAVSQHLRVLRAAGLVAAEKRGYFVHYRVDKEALRRVNAHLQSWSKTLLAPADKGCPKAKHCHKTAGRTGTSKGRAKS